MKIYYRWCDINSTNASPILSDDRPGLNKLCLESFYKVYGEQDITFIFDNTTFESINFATSLYPNSKKIITHNGINESCLMQYRLYESSKHDYVLFQECDYFHIKPITEVMIRELEYISPYDHPDKYPNEISQIKIVDNHHFKHTRSTTSTFATNREGFLKNKDIFYKHGYIDHERWIEIGGLWSPIPTFATHMVTSYLSPSIEWKNHFSVL